MLRSVTILLVYSLLCASHSLGDTCTCINVGKSSGSTAQRRFFRSVHLLSVPSKQPRKEEDISGLLLDCWDGWMID